MRELRTCPVTGRAVLLNDAWLDESTPAPTDAAPCWYCRFDGWSIAERGPARAVAHPEPALGIEGDPRPVLVAGASRRQAVGAHELVFGAHDGGDAPLLALLAARMTDLRGDPRLRGFAASRRVASDAHVAWQLFAFPYPLPDSRPAGWRDAERAHGERVVADAGATTLLAWAPRVPFETWVLPALGTAGLERSASEVIGAVANAVADALDVLAIALRSPIVDVAFVDGEPWRVELRPRLGGPAAVEAAMGVPVHGVFPEAAARHWRSLSRSPGRSGTARVDPWTRSA